MREATLLDTRTLKSRVFPPLLLVAITFCVYVPSLGFDFVPSWDDDLYVTTNEAVRGFSLHNLKTAFSSIYGGNYAPLQIISYMLDYTFWGMNPAGYHLSNILVHAANGILLLQLMTRLGLSRTTAFLSATIFLIHPVQVESVAWISQRKNVLALFFILASFHYYLNYRNLSAAGNRGIHYTLSLVCALLALLSKSVAVIIPFLFMLHDLCFASGTSWKKRLIDTVPFLIAAGSAAVATIIFQHADYGGGRLSIQITPLVVAFSMPGVIADYLGLIFFPTTHRLCNIYLPRLHASFGMEVMPGILVLMLLAALGVLLFRRNRPLLFWYAAAWLAFLPVSQIVPLTTIMNDRYLYVPMIGISPLLVITAMSAVSRIRAGYYARAAIGVLCILLAVISTSRSFVWKDELALWNDAYQKNPGDYHIMTFLGNVLRQRGDEHTALSLYKKAFSLKPDYVPLLKGLGEYHLDTGDYAAAREYLRRFTLSSPRNAAAFELYGLACKHAGDLAEAEKAFLKALEIEGTVTQAPLLLSNIYLSRGDLPSARRYMGISIKNGLGELEAAYESACIEAQAGNDGLAVKHLEHAVQLGFSDAEILLRDPFLAPLRKNPAQIESLIRSIDRQ